MNDDFTKMEWVVAITEDNLLTKNGVAVTGARFAFLLPVTAERLAEIKESGVAIGDMRLSMNPEMFGAVTVDKLIAFSIEHGLSSEEASMGGREPDDRMCSCDGGCGWHGRYDQLGREWWEADAVHLRMDAGELCPAGECPVCGTFAHLDEIPSHTVQIVLEFAARRRRRGEAE